MAGVNFVLLETGLDAMIKALRTVGGSPTHETTAELEGALAKAFTRTQEQVHVLSGTLKASGRTSTDLRGKVWSGGIGYGGRHGTPAYYAIYEMNRGGNRADTGTPHDFFSGLEAYDEDFEAAIDAHFKIMGGAL